MSILIFDFSGIYEAEGIAGCGTCLDLKDLSGTGMYVDEEAERTIRERLEKAGGPDRYLLRFLDNGNYHYMSRILASYIKEPFDLITFDHHTDDQPPAFAGLKSCGSWRLDIMNENRMLQSSFLIQSAEDFGKLYSPSSLPLYISLDKDILSEEALKTNWDQGDMSEEELFSILDTLFKTRNVIAFDVCGEDLADAPCDANERFNRSLIDELTRWRNMASF